MKRVLICLENGAPKELMRDALEIGNGVARQDCDVTYAVGDPVTFVDFAGGWIPSSLRQAPVIRPAPQLVMKRPPIDGFADVIAASGFEDKQTLMTVSTIWSALFEELKPRVIVGFHSPVVWMLGPAHARTFALGRGFALPPVLGSSFPRLTPQSSPLAAEEVMLANANAVLGKLGNPALGALSEVLSGCSPVLYGVPAFDPYLQLRSAVSSGVLRKVAAPEAPPSGARLAVFLDIACPGIETIVLALAACGSIAVDVYINGITAPMRRFLEQRPGVRVWAQHSALLENSVHAGAIVHHGEQDVAEHAMAVGRPQMFVPWTREQRMLCEMVKWMGLSWLKDPSASVDDFSGTFRALLRDGSLTVAAQHHAGQLAKTGLPEALTQIVQEITRGGSDRRGDFAIVTGAAANAV